MLGLSAVWGCGVTFLFFLCTCLKGNVTSVHMQLTIRKGVSVKGTELGGFPGWFFAALFEKLWLFPSV